VPCEFLDGSSQLVSEHRRWNDHFRVVTPFEDLEIRAARQCCFDTHARFPRAQRLRRNFLYSDILFPVENSGFHARQLRDGASPWRAQETGCVEGASAEDTR
jgi:hypothetical protein